MSEELETIARKSPWKKMRNYLYGAATVAGGLGLYFGYDLSEILQGNSAHDSYIVGSALMGCVASSYVSGQLGIIAHALHKRSLKKDMSNYQATTEE